MMELQKIYINRENSILVIVDMENECCKPGGKLYSETGARIMPGVISGIHGIAERARSAGIPIIKVHPSRVRPAIAFNGHTPASDEVVDTINMLFGLNLTEDQHDTAFAYAVAMAGEAQWRASLILESVIQ